MLAVADTTPLRYLLVIGAIDILPALYERVAVPYAVAEELQHPHAPDRVRAWMAAPPPWIGLHQPQGALRLPRLGRGEQDAIVLAGELRADLILMDDEDGRMEAERLGMTVVGTLGVLERAAEWGLIDLPDVLARLQATTFFAPAGIIAAMLARDAARKDRAQGS